MRHRVLCVVATAGLAIGQTLPPEPSRDSGSSITGAFEGVRAGIPDLPVECFVRIDGRGIFQYAGPAVGWGRRKGDSPISLRESHTKTQILYEFCNVFQLIVTLPQFPGIVPEVASSV